jgi:integrase
MSICPISAASIAGLPKLGWISSEAAPGVAPSKLLRHSRGNAERTTRRAPSVWWYAFGLLSRPKARRTVSRKAEQRSRRRRVAKARARQVVLISSNSPRTVKRFFETLYRPECLKGTTKRYTMQHAGVVAALSRFCACEATLDQLSDSLLENFFAWYAQTHSEMVTTARWGMLRGIWREAHRRGLVSTRPCVRRADTSLILLKNYCRPDRVIRAYFDSVYWPRRSAFCCAGSERDYTSAINALCRFSACEVTLDQLSEDLFERFAGARLRAGRSAATVNKNISMIAALWRFAFRKRVLDDLPRDLEKIPEFKRLPEAWSVDQFAIILDAAAATKGTICAAPADHFFLALLLTLYDTGLRIGAVLKLSVEALDAERRWLTIPAEFQKQKAGQALLLDAKTVELLRTLPRNGSDRLFPVHRWKHPIVALERRYRRILQGAGLPSGRRDLFHKIRRTNATYTADAEGEQAAQRQLGHSSVSMTRRNYIDPRLLTRDRNAALIPRPNWTGQSQTVPAPAPAEIAVGASAVPSSIQRSISDGPAAPSLVHRAARGAHERGFSNPK